MSYAAVASHNIPAGEQPKPDQSLLDGHFAGEHEAHPLHQDEKINILPAGSDLEHPPIEQERSPRPAPVSLSAAPEPEVNALHVAPEPVQVPINTAKWDKAEKKAEHALDDAAKKAKSTADEAEAKAEATADKVEKKGKEYAKKAKKELREAESKLGPYWEKTKDVVLRPSTLGGLVGVANVGLLATLGYYGYTRRDQPWDRRLVGGAIAGTLALFGAEGYVAESYLETPEGKKEAERAKREGSKIYVQAREVVLRPGVAGGLAGVFNLAVLSTVGYFSYKHWNQPWDRRIVSAVSVGLLGLSGLEGWAGKVYKEKELPKH